MALPSAFIRPAALAAAFLLLAPAAQADKADRDQPMQIEADALRHEEKTRTSTFTGRVTLTQGTITMRGHALVVQQDAAGHARGHLSAGQGQRAAFRQKRQGLNEHIEGQANRIEYNSRSDTVVLTGRALMRRLAGGQVADEVAGERITYNHQSEIYTVGGPAQAPRPGLNTTEGPAASGRVRATIAPRPRPAPESTGQTLPLRPAAQLRPKPAGATP